MAVDVNAGHLAVAVAAADGNVLGAPATIPLDLVGLPAPEEAARPAQARPRTTPAARPRTKEARHPTRPPAATRHQDRQAPQDNGRQPGSPGPSGAAGLARTMSR